MQWRAELPKVLRDLDGILAERVRELQYAQAPQTAWERAAANVLAGILSALQGAQLGMRDCPGDMAADWCAASCAMVWGTQLTQHQAPVHVTNTCAGLPQCCCRHLHLPSSTVITKLQIVCGAGPG